MNLLQHAANAVLLKLAPHGEHPGGTIARRIIDILGNTVFGTDTAGNATITPPVTFAGAVTFSGNVTNSGVGFGSIQALSGAGAVNVTTDITRLTTTGGAQALSLANGTAGQKKEIIHEVDGGSAVLTPTTKTGFTTITFTAVGDSCVLRYLATRGWMIVALNGAVAA